VAIGGIGEKVDDIVCLRVSQFHRVFYGNLDLTESFFVLIVHSSDLNLKPNARAKKTVRSSLRFKQSSKGSGMEIRVLQNQELRSSSSSLQRRTSAAQQLSWVQVSPEVSGRNLDRI
jgi:hypothetical protein